MVEPACPNLMYVNEGDRFAEGHSRTCSLAELRTAPPASVGDRVRPSTYACPGRSHGWLNSEPLGPAELRGRVLVDFWTLTCINWLRTEPYVRAWARA